MGIFDYVRFTNKKTLLHSSEGNRRLGLHEKTTESLSLTSGADYIELTELT